MLKAIPVKDFQRCYQKWEQRLHLCIAAQGNYFEMDNIGVWKNKYFDKSKISLITFVPHLVYGFDALDLSPDNRNIVVNKCN